MGHLTATLSQCRSVIETVPGSVGPLQGKNCSHRTLRLDGLQGIVSFVEGAAWLRGESRSGEDGGDGHRVTAQCIEVAVICADDLILDVVVYGTARQDSKIESQ
jgi:hypothetical protein